MKMIFGWDTGNEIMIYSLCTPYVVPIVIIVLLILLITSNIFFAPYFSGIKGTKIIMQIECVHVTKYIDIYKKPEIILEVILLIKLKSTVDV